MKNQFERTIRTKLGIHEGELDAADLLKITTLQLNSASQEDINDLFLTPSLINLTIICEGDIDLSPLNALPLLDSLRIANANIEHFSPLEKFYNKIFHQEIDDNTQNN